jgi:hypothetical protein
LTFETFATLVFGIFFPALMQEAQISTDSPLTRRAWRFTFWRRLVAMLEWLRLTLERKRRSQFEHLRDIFLLGFSAHHIRVSGSAHPLLSERGWAEGLRD